MSGVHDGLHVLARDARVPPLADGSTGDTQVVREGRGSAATQVQPVVKTHPASLRTLSQSVKFYIDMPGDRIKVDISPTKNSSASATVLSRPMDDIRREWLRVLIRDQFGGSRTRLMKKTGLTSGRIAQLLDERMPFGEVAARNLAERLGLEQGFFDRRPGEVATYAAPARALQENPFAAEVAERLAALHGRSPAVFRRAYMELSAVLTRLEDELDAAALPPSAPGAAPSKKPHPSK